MNTSQAPNSTQHFPLNESYFASLDGEQKKSALVFLRSIQSFLDVNSADSRNSLRQLVENWNRENIDKACAPLIQSILLYLDDDLEIRGLSERISLILNGS